MLVTDLALLVDQQQGWHAPELEKVPLLAVEIGHLVAGIGQPEVVDVFAFPVPQEGLGPVRANCDDDRVTRGEGRQIVAQAREMGAAVGSHEPAQEDQHDVFPAKIPREAHVFTTHIG